MRTVKLSTPQDTKAILEEMEAQRPKRLTYMSKSNLEKKKTVEMQGAQVREERVRN
jgi:hypothetical protein